MQRVKKSEQTGFVLAGFSLRAFRADVSHPRAVCPKSEKGRTLFEHIATSAQEPTTAAQIAVLDKLGL